LVCQRQPDFQHLPLPICQITGVMFETVPHFITSCSGLNGLFIAFHSTQQDFSNGVKQSQLFCLLPFWFSTSPSSYRLPVLTKSGCSARHRFSLRCVSHPSGCRLRDSHGGLVSMQTGRYRLLFDWSMDTVVIRP